MIFLMEVKVSSSTIDLCLLKQGDAPNLQRVYLKDLQKTKSIKGADFEVQNTQFALNLKTSLFCGVKY